MTTPIEVLITLPFSEELLNQLRGVSPRLKITPYRARKPEDIPPDVWARAEVLYTNDVLPTPEQAPQLRWIQFHWAGIDHILDSPLLNKPDLMITTLSGVAATRVAEYAMMMLLALGQHLPDLIAVQKKGEWPRDRLERFAPQELRTSTIGIVGYGSIGRQIARLLREFGSTVLATKRDVMHPEDAGYVPEGQGDVAGELVHRMYPPQALQSMLKECDFVVVTIPLTRDTRHMIGAAELAVMKPNAYLIDISRGSIVDPNALVAALRDRKIAGAALDVFEQEPLPADHPLWKLPNVITTPHLAGITRQYTQRAANLFAENLTRYLAGMPLYNRFDLERGY